MNLDLFAEMSPEDARAFLRTFLERGEAFATGLGIRQVGLDHMPNVLLDLSKEMRVTPRPADPNVPAFIRETKEYRSGLFDFTSESIDSIVGAAWSLGQAFLATYPFMAWGIGDAAYATKRMPVVLGFKAGMELPPLLVVRNMFARRVRDPQSDTHIETTIRTWRRHALETPVGD